VVVVDLNQLNTLLDKGFVSYEQAERFYQELSKSAYCQVVCILLLNYNLKCLKHLVKAPRK
jgi:hypothetical protein